MPHMTNPLLTPYPPACPATRQRLLCFPFAGAGASIFREWPLNLPTDIHVFGIQLPGRENRIGEPPLRNLLTAARSIAVVLSRYGELPFALFGHSAGALMAFEVARALRALNGPVPAHLFVSGFRGPSEPDRDKPIHALPDDSFTQELRRLGGTPEEIFSNQEVIQFMLPALRADFELVETYRYERQEPLECPITVLGGLHDRRVRNNDLPAWQIETRAAFNIRMFPGDHYFLRTCRVAVLRVIAGQLAAKRF
jgi:surfactin synthase thioesterase subunit